MDLIPGSGRSPGGGNGNSLEKSHGQRSLGSYSPWGHTRVGHNLATKQQHQQSYWIKGPPYSKINSSQPMTSVVVLFPNKFDKRGAGCWDLNIWMWGLGDIIQTIAVSISACAPSAGYVKAADQVRVWGGTLGWPGQRGSTTVAWTCRSGCSLNQLSLLPGTSGWEKAQQQLNFTNHPGRQ